GDGVPDLLVGAPGASTATLTFAGQARVFSGATGALLATLTGVGPSDFFGTSVAGAGDVNGDGTPDLVVGAIEDPFGPLAGPGYASVFSGGTGVLLGTVAGTALNAFFGSRVAGAGDADGDGADDILVGASFALQATLFSGATGVPIVTLAGAFGTSVSGVGDLNGDGLAEFISGHPAAGPGAAGQATVFAAPSGTPLFVLNGAAFGEGFGRSVARLGDVNGDGVDDFAVGAHGQAGNCTVSFCPAGYVAVFSGATGASLFTATAGVSGDGLGVSVAGAGDLNGDGIPDLVAGTYYSAYATPSSDAYAYSGANGALLYEFEGAGGFGYAVASAGDVNGDGIPDMIIGAPYASPGGNLSAGEASVYSVVGVPAGSTLAGSGCPGSGGVIPLIQTAGGDPSPGNAGFSLVLSRALGGATTVLIAGAAPVSVNLGPLGMPGCTLLASPDVILPGSVAGAGAGNGVRFEPAPVPPVPALVGGLVQLQYYVVDPGPAPVPGAMSQRLQLQIVP
ncbi:MAG: FG-GAP-like repeat-containing protein, partial [Planctomycetes bacterium]|nr:FG-GAP-like repeat-containing protein [Planctomycetota bacterium]